MKRFEFIEHTADKGAIAYGRTRAEVFANGALSMISLMTDPGAFSPDEWREIDLTAPDIGSLFVRWLSELVFLLDVESLLAVEFDVREAEAEALKVRVGFARVNRETFEQRGALVKAITYHDLEVAETDGGWRARYYVDV